MEGNCYAQGRQTQQNSGGGVAEIAKIDVTTCVGSTLLAFLRKAIKKAPFLYWGIKKDILLDVYAIKGPLFTQSD